MLARKIALILALCLAVAMLLPLVAAAAPDLQPKIPHSLDGRNNCTGCHTVGGAGVGAPGGTGLPSNHQGRTSDMCQGCHQPAAAAPASSGNTTNPPAASSNTASQPAGGTQTQQTSATQAAPAQAQKAPQPETGKLPTTGENDFQYLPVLIAAAVLLIGGVAMRKATAHR